MTFTVQFEPAGISVACEPGMTILEAVHLAGIPLHAVCGGRGHCAKCQVRILSGDRREVPPFDSLEEKSLSAAALERGYRLACRHGIAGDMTIETVPITSYGIGSASFRKREVPGEGRAFDFGPAIRRYELTLVPPSLERPLDDASHLLQTLNCEAQVLSLRRNCRQIDYKIIQTLPHTLRNANWQVVVSTRGSEVIGVRPSATAAPPLGMAVDLGTTNIAIYVYNLDDGSQIDVIGLANPLAAYGADILSRLIYARRSPDHSAQLQRTLIKTLNLLVAYSAEAHGFLPGDVEEMVVVGNSGMHHLFLDLPSQQLLNAPYVAATRQAMSIKARELGLELSQGAYVYMPPLVGGFVGSDLLGVALSTRIDQQPGIRLAIDIGTNTELLLAVNGTLYSCSTASGPALEGAALRFGSVAMPGTIDRVRYDKAKDTMKYHTIHNEPAIGICGSGIIDALAAMNHAGIINASGRLQAGATQVLEAPQGDREFVLVPAVETGLAMDLTISQHDIRAIQLAKGAIRGGIETLMSEHGLGPDDITEILIAGAFGNYLRIESTLATGLLPPVSPDRIRQIGNAAGTGAGLMLLSTRERAAAEELSSRINYLELSIHPRFKRLFAYAQFFPETCQSI